MALNLMLEPDTRVLTFGNGMVVRERIVDTSDGAKRVVWSAESELLTDFL